MEESIKHRALSALDKIGMDLIEEVMISNKDIAWKYSTIKVIVAKIDDLKERILKDA